VVQLGPSKFNTWLTDDAPERQFLFDVRAGKMTHEHLLATVASDIAWIEGNLNSSSLPKELTPQGRAAIQKWLINVRAKHSRPRTQTLSGLSAHPFFT
jgi:hypothetical protein